MKTIEERAKEYAKGRRYEIVAYVAYIAGAIVQEDIDIDKACEWLERANSALPPCYKMFEVNIENFRKAMEG